MAKFVFCFPYRGIGGVPVLFVRIADFVVRGGAHQAVVVDYAGGAMAKAVTGSSITLLVYNDDEPVAIPEDAILIFQSLNPWALYPSLRIPDTTRIFFWNCHPFNLVPVFPGLRAIMMASPGLGRLFLVTVLRRYRSIVIRLITFLLARGALAFMDKTNVENTENYLNLTLPKQGYLPVPASGPCGRIARPPRNWARDGLRLVWIGRIADFKYPILRKTLQLLDRLASSLQIPMRFTVVGSGAHANDLAHDIVRLKHLNVEMMGELSLSGIEPFLLEQADILFAMGISALEGIRLGIPTVLLDISYREVPDSYIFTWMHERSGYTLGEIVSPALLRLGNDSLAILLQQAMADYDGLASAAQAYYNQSHSLESVGEKFLQLTLLSRCFYKDFREAGFSKRDPVYELFSRLRRRFNS